MSNNEQQNSLPESFGIELVKHGESWHVTRLHDRLFPHGQPELQPEWSQVEAKLTALGYTEADEIPNQPGAQRKLILTKPAAPSLLDKLIDPTIPADAITDTPVQHIDMVRETTRRKFGKL